MIFGVDTSGKINQLPMWVGVVKPKRRGILEELKKSVARRKPVISARRRLNGRYLNQGEIEKLVENTSFSVGLLRAPVYASCLRNFRSLHDPKVRVLASVIFLTLKDLPIREEDVILVDKDYDYDKMRFLCSSIGFLLRKFEGKNLDVEVGTSYNESIGLADIVAKLGRLGKLQASEMNPNSLEKYMSAF
ncbi:hypothetical protein AKJ42_00670 [candidate division MSBL1 archaeon SCGC-AAA261C02]|uniref:Uncharacterized protein n=1 Tax=candidate division MSBL1 archaeon SCGC-AAA261C02 TaxID=1698272 RepID=A0A133V1V5_9EURY|nr:hypothetical protein AKJ42_00670 [candidate division MSBL1 archaeon SCGC-AAA261C02]